MHPIPERFALRGRRALVTGSSKGIGAAIATTFAEAGADVVIHCSQDCAAARDVVAAAAARGVRVAFVPADLSHDDAAATLFSAAVVALGGIDILVLNASVQIPRAWTEITRAELDRQVAVDFRCSFDLLQLAAPPMCERKWGRLLTIGSVQEAKPHPQMLVYSALKRAQTGLMVSLAKQLAPHGVTANNVAPGVIDTDRTRARLTDPAYVRRVIDGIPAGRIGTPDDCAGAVLLLCSEAGSYITGQNLYVDGGMSL
jgi:NAD(P)-dependent dehydrogenase (short-subunit alcohol dehydrogenase family)